MASTLVSCRWDWCRSSFLSIDALDTHVKHEHIWPMKPMRKTEITLMRRMDMQSLHSSLDTQSSIVSRVTGVSPSNAFTQLSSPPHADAPSKLPTLAAFEGLVRQDEHSRLSAAAEMFERTYAYHTPLSASQEAIAQQLTQLDNVGSQPQPRIEDRLDTELRWPTDDEEMQSSEQFLLAQNHLPRGSLNVPFNSNSSDAGGYPSQSQQFVLLTQAPYFSPATNWSQSQ